MRLYRRWQRRLRIKKAPLLALLALAVLSALLATTRTSGDAVSLSDVANLSIGEAVELLQQSENGVALSPYLVKCALGPTDNVPLANGSGVVLKGGQSLAPAWLNRPLSPSEQRIVSACILSVMNYSGAHVQVMLTSTSSGLPNGPAGRYQFQEGAFYGNLFLKDPLSFVCSGDSDTSKSTFRSLRVCTEAAGNGESKCGMALTGSCQSVCEPSPNGGAYHSCKGQNESYEEVITVYLEHTGKSAAKPGNT